MGTMTDVQNEYDLELLYDKICTDWIYCKLDFEADRFLDQPCN